MELLFNIFLAIHILSGSVGLLSGTLNIIQRKGGRNHMLIGKIFVWAMVTAGFSSLVLAALHANLFLAMVGIFTLYLTGSGQRYMMVKNNFHQQAPHWIDYLLFFGMLGSGIIFIGYGSYLKIEGNNFGIVMLVFGSIGLLFIRRDIQYFKGKAKEENYWLIAHLQRMTGAFIASATAFLVVNYKYLPEAIPGFLVWLLPTLLLAPLITFWSIKKRILKEV